ncbi:PDxFFG protein [Mycoplasma sp. Z631]|uniref:PDxFFG protein n=1 Tax=Mycoplasma sp. Z631 TaxID=3401685 RepID=UPI003AB10256
MIKNWSLKTKVLLSLATLSVGAGIAIGSMIAYAENSDEKLGPLSPANKMLFNNDYAKIYDKEGNLKPELAILDPQKKNKVAVISPDASEYWFIQEPSKKYNFTDFFNAYFEKFNEAFVLEVKYGSFSFYNEYVLAVHPEQFIEFSNWFIKNVAWGPDLLTLDSFRIVPGVEQNGNAITLGSHSTLHKEVSEIKFFPDAFFGSLPIHSLNGGRGNAPDALTYTTFKNEVSKAVLDDYLKNIPLASAIKNASVLPNYSSYREILITSKLNGEKFQALLDQNINSKGQIIRNQTLFLPFDVTKDQFNELKAKYPDELENATFEQLRPVEIISATTAVDNKNEDKPQELERDLHLNITFKYLDVTELAPEAIEEELAKIKDLASDTPAMLAEKKLKREEINNVYSSSISFATIQGRSYESYKLFKEVANSKIRNFLDFYDIDSYSDGHDSIFVYKPRNGQPMQYFASFLEAINTVPELAQASYVKQKALVKKYSIVKMDIVNNPEVKLHTLNVTLQSDDSQKRELYLSFSASEANNYQPEGFEQFKDALGYLGTISPVTLFYTPEDKTLVDENGNSIEGLAARKYQVYNEAYAGLIQKVTAKYPHLLRKLNGPHIVKTVDENGVYQYQLQDGPYRGLTPGDRIGLPLVLGALIPDFKGVPTDFLKYVATHEYGHHYTLDQGQAWINDKNPIIVGGLSTRGGANESSYYSYEALVNYLEARTNIEVIRVNANNQPTEYGKFIRFRFGILDENGKVIKFETEALSDIWGTKKSNDDIFNVLKNEKRRFLQDFAGMVKAAKERNVALGDLFIANSFDADSGTLNPRISGIAKAFEKIQNASGNYNYKLVPITAREVISQMKDGYGNPLTNIVTFSDDNNFTIKIYEADEKNPSIIRKINMYKKDNTPVINVPLNIPLDEESLNYLHTQAHVIEESIRATINRDMFDSGWDTNATRIGGKFDFFTTSLFNQDNNVNQLLQSLKGRENKIEIEPSTNANALAKGENKVRQSNTYFALGAGLRNEINDINRYISDMATGLNGDAVKISIYRNSGLEPVLAFRESQDDTVLTIDKFVFPYMSGNYFLGDIANYRDSFANRISSLATDYGTNDTKARWSNHILFSFLEASGWTARSNNNPTGRTDTLFGYIDRSDVLMSTSQVRDLAANPLNKFGDQVRGMVINPFSSGINASDRALLKAINRGKNNAHQANVSLPGSSQTEKTYRADSFHELLNFASINYAKASYSIDSESYNWDIAYVESKFDLNEIQALSASDNNKEAAELVKAIKQAGSETDKKQALANYAMYRFRHSNLVLSVVDFSPATDLVANRAVFSKLYGITIIDPVFNKYYMEDTSKATENAHLVFDVTKLQTFIQDLLKEHNFAQQAQYLSLSDFLSLVGNSLMWKDHGLLEPKDATLFNVFWGGFTSGEPSSDVINYNDTRVEPLLNDKFTDYIYSIAETLTRDYVQTVYSPDTKDFGNTPDYLSGLNEAITGLDYIVDGTKLNYLNDKRNDIKGIAKGLKATLEASRLSQYFEQSIDSQILANKQIAKLKHEYEDAIVQLAKYKPNTTEYNIYSNYLHSKQEAYLNATANKVKANLDLKTPIFKEISDKDFLNADSYLSSNYFGKFISNSNGFFKDRFEKETIGMELYDTDRNPIIDENIRLKDFEGNKITKRPEAFFISQLLNYGVSKRSISGIFRNKDLDALAMYGYIKKDLAAQVKYIKFTDVDTKEEKFLKVNTNKTNNIFWLEKQGDVTTKKTIEDYGYTSWLTDYALMAKYRDALLKPKHRYYIEFANDDKKAIQDVDLGNVDAISENAKASQQSPIKIIPEMVTVVKNGVEVEEKTGKSIISIDYQFNITH